MTFMPVIYKLNISNTKTFKTRKTINLLTTQNYFKNRSHFVRKDACHHTFSFRWTIAIGNAKTDLFLDSVRSLLKNAYLKR